MLARTPAPIRLRVHMGFAGKTYDLNVGTPAWTVKDAKRDIRTVALIPEMCQQLFFGMTELTDDELPLASIEGFDRGEAMDLQLIIKTGPKWAEEERLILDKIRKIHLGVSWPSTVVWVYGTYLQSWAGSRIWRYLKSHVARDCGLCRQSSVTSNVCWSSRS